MPAPVEMTSRLEANPSTPDVEDDDEGDSEGLSAAEATPANSTEGPFRLFTELSIEKVKENRHFDCVHYETCLIVAAKQRWMSWSCKGCTKYEAGENPTAAVLATTRRHSNLASGD
jgi:hypothetical protein